MTLVIDYAYWPRLPHQPHLPRLPGLPHLPFTCLAYLAYLAFLAYIAYAYRVGDEVNWKENLLVYVNMYFSANVLMWVCTGVQMYLKQSGSWGSAVRDHFDINGSKRGEAATICETVSWRRFNLTVMRKAAFLCTRFFKSHNGQWVSVSEVVALIQDQCNLGQIMLHF